MKKPLYVKVGLLAVPTRKAAKYYLYFCLLIVLLSFIASIVIDTEYYIGLVFLSAAFWYQMSIKWMDDNGAW